MALPEDLIRLEQNLRELIIKYEQYFIGIEKREPMQLLDEVERQVRQYQNVTISNTMLKFKYQSLAASLSTQKQKWTRITRLIEEGKYSRDRFRMERRQDEPRRPASPQEAAENQLERIYQQYLEARRSCNLPVKNVSREKIAAAIAQQRPAIADRYRCRNIDYSVVIEDGKPRIKAHPKQ
ncbi:MXAN_5187 C-terminal domain-containing protein [Geomesophilobacter sediminis]|uniref:Uncharacterized protein n=1 Tax=Geomesophilobacter sediminis TaxID=2798584 RepID=A0A8J7LYF6_9BACT|nr:MXAN_5187 C-terminal domain-containing protein [Geomesophilobacter sediminis]MBJ6724717.1 hypothetical protein [Geomesophilobacter sediminis]